MTNLLAAQPVFLFSIFKTVLFLAALGAWGWGITRLDKDLMRFGLPRTQWNAIHLAVGLVAFFIWIMLPFFWLGLVLVVVLVTADLAGYTFYRNPRVPKGYQWTFRSNVLGEKFDEFKQAQAERSATIHFLSSDGRPLEVPSDGEPEADVHAAIERLLDFALPRRGERIDLLVDGQQAALSVQIDGVHYPQPNVDPRLGMALIDYLKAHAGMDVNDRRRKQTGRVSIDANGNGQHTLDMSTLGSTRGLSLAIEIDAAGRRTLALEKLGLLDTQRQALKPLLAEHQRVVLVASPPDQGQTTTLYSLVSAHDPYIHNIATIEEKIDRELEGVTQEIMPPNMEGPELSKRIQAVLNRDPQVVMLSKLIDGSNAHLIAQHVEHTRFYIGVRLDDTFAALRAWMKAIGDPRRAADALGAIVAQRLIRRLCTTCRVAYTPDPEALRKLNLPAERVGQFYKHSGQLIINKKARPCPDCLGIGYRGRIGVFEVLVFDDQARQLAAANQLDQLRAHVRQQKMLWLQEAALRQVISGETSITEATRALGKEKV